MAEEGRRDLHSSANFHIETTEVYGTFVEVGKIPNSGGSTNRKFSSKNVVCLSKNDRTWGLRVSLAVIIANPISCPSILFPRPSTSVPHFDTLFVAFVGD